MEANTVRLYRVAVVKEIWATDEVQAFNKLEEMFHKGDIAQTDAQVIPFTIQGEVGHE